MAHLVSSGRWARRRLGNWKKNSHMWTGSTRVREREKKVDSLVLKIKYLQCDKHFPINEQHVCWDHVCDFHSFFVAVVSFFLKFTLKSEVVLLSSKNSCSSSVSSQGSLKFYCREREKRPSWPHYVHYTDNMHMQPCVKKKKEGRLLFKLNCRSIKFRLKWRGVITKKVTVPTVK